MQLTGHHKERYGEWAGRPNGDAPDPERCAYEVFPSGGGLFFHQCSRKRGHGPEGAFCRQHDPAAQAERDRKANIKWRLDGWHSYGRASARGKIAGVAIDMLHQRATMDDLEAAVSEYEAECAKMAALGEELK